MPHKYSLVLFILTLFILTPSSEISAQESLDKYAYRSPDFRRVYRVHDNKKLNDKEILQLMKDDVVAQEKFKKSLKYRKAAWITAGAFVAVAAYVLPQEEFRNNDFSDYNTGQKIATVAYVGTGLGFCYSLVSYAIIRGKSISRICLPCKEKELGHLDRAPQKFLEISYQGTGVGLSYNF